MREEVAASCAAVAVVAMFPLEFPSDDVGVTSTFESFDSDTTGSIFEGGISL